MDENIDAIPGLIEQLATDIRTDLARYGVHIDEGAADELAIMVCRDVGMVALIAASSLGTPEAKSIRARTPAGVARAIVDAGLPAWSGKSFAERLIDFTTNEDPMNGGPTNPEDRPEPNINASRIGVVARAAHNHYVSTGCMHGRHDECRWTCKFCHDRCRCPCHDGRPPPELDSNRYELEAVDDQGNYADGQKDITVDEAMSAIRHHLKTGKTVTASAMEEEPPGEEAPGV